MPHDVIIESYLSGEIKEGGGSGSKTIIYRVNCANEDIAADWALNESLSYVTLPSGSSAYRDNYTVSPEGGRIFEVTIEYTTAAANNQDNQDPESEAVDRSFDIGGQSVHTTQSKQTVNSYGTNPPDFKGAIGVSKDGVAGVEDEVGTLAWSEPHDLPRSTVTPAFARMLRSAYGRTNSKVFRGFAIGEVKFKGMTGQPKNADIFGTNWKFEAGEHATNLKVGDIANIAKKAWDYLWVRYKDDEDQTVLVKKPEHVYVERLKDAFDFDLFGIG